MIAFCGMVTSHLHQAWVALFGGDGRQRAPVRDGEGGQAGHRVGDFRRGDHHIQLGQLHGIPMWIAPQERIGHMLQVVLWGQKQGRVNNV